MLRSILIEFRKRAGSYISPSIIIVSSLLVCFFLFNILRPSLMGVIEPEFELNRENVIMAKIQLFIPFRTLENGDVLLEELLKEVKELDGVESVTYSLSDIDYGGRTSELEIIYKNCYTLYVARNFLDFFGIEIIEGSGFEKDYIRKEIIVSEIYAEKKGIKELPVKMKSSRYAEDENIDLVAIYKGDLNAYNSRTLSRDTPILFVPIDLKNDDIMHAGLNLLFKAKRSSDQLLICKQIDEIIKEERYRDMLYSSATLPFSQHERLSKYERLKHEYIILIPFLIFIIYISVSLLSSMINIMEARTHEIGVRRALGHTKRQVMLFIIVEPLIIFTFNAIIAISIFWSLKDLIGIIRPEEIIIAGTALIFIVVLLSLIYPLVKLTNTNHIDVIQSE